MSKKLTFLRIPKNASTSIYSFFGNANTIRNEYLSANNEKYLNVFEPSHCTLKEAKSILGDHIEDLPVLAVVRNPYERLVSMYFFARKHNLGSIYKIDTECFEKFASDFYEWSKNPNFFHAKSQIDYFKECKKTYICRFENLYIELGKFIKNENLGFDIHNLEKLNSTKRKSYRSYHTEKTKSIVREMWSEDLSRFSYSY